MSVPKLILTDSGSRLLTRALAGEVITFTRMAMGDGKLTATGAIPGLSDLIHSVITIPITKKKRREMDVTLSGVVTLTATTPEFRWRELGVFARIGNEAEKLYGYLNLYEDGEIVKPDEGMERSVYITVAVGDAQNVEVILADISTPEVGDLTPVANELASAAPQDMILISDVSDSGIIKMITVEAFATSHAHEWSSIKNKPNTFPPATHSHTPSSIGAASSSHYHYWSSIREKPSVFPPTAHTHQASDITPFELFLSTTLSIQNGEKQIDFGSASGLLSDVMSKYQLLVVRISGTLTNGSSKNSDYYGLGGVNGISSTIYNADDVIDAGKTVTLNDIHWFFAASDGKWRKDSEKGQTTGAYFRVLGNPLLFEIFKGYCTGSLTMKAYGMKIWSVPTSSGGGGGDEIPEIPVGDDIQVPLD